MQFIKSILVCGVLLAIFAADAQAVMMNWSAVGNAGNAADPADGDGVMAGIQNLGAVPYAYNIGTYDVTVSQYVEFLNAKDAHGTNSFSLYNVGMSTFPAGGISFNRLDPVGNIYSVIAGDGNHPVNQVSWYDAIRFANWTNNGQGNGDTETGAYTLGAQGGLGQPLVPPLTHNAGAQIWLPTENEWYKAAYYNPATDSYFRFPTSSNDVPIASAPTGLANHANYNRGVGNLTDVGAYSGTTSPYGAFDMAGNIDQFNEDLIIAGNRGLRGGSFLTASWLELQSSFRNYNQPSHGVSDIGFRLASVANVPEPSTGVLAVIAGGMLWWWHQKRFK